MRLAYLTPQYPKVSHTFIRREIRALEDRGHSVVRISIRRPDDTMLVDPADREERARTIFCLATRVDRLVRAVFSTVLRHPTSTLEALRKALQLARRADRGWVAHIAYWIEACFVLKVITQAEVEHLHVHFGTNAATVALLVRIMGGPPFSMTVHGPDEIDSPRGHLIREKIQASTFTVGISHYTVAQLRRWVDVEQWTKLHVVRCTIDDKFLSEATPMNASSLNLLCVGRLCPQKGQVGLLEAFAQVREKLPEARLILAGDGDMRPEVEAARLQLGLEQHVEITGWIDETTIRQHLRDCRAMVLASYAEGLPVVIMEAMAMHRPVISTYIAGIPELVLNDTNGWLVPAGDRKALTQAMLDALQRPGDELAILAEHGAERVRRLHNAEVEAARLESLFMN